MTVAEMLDDEPPSKRSLLDELALRGHTRVFPPRTIIIHEDDTSDTIYVIQSGRCKIYSTGENGKEIVFGICGPGDTLGEPVLDGGPRTASVATLEQTVCTAIRISDFRDLVRNDPDFAFQVIARLIGMLRAANGQVKSLALEDVYGRVVRFLMREAEVEGDHWAVNRRLTQQEIADHVGSSREMVSRIFKDLEKGAYITVGKDRIVIHRKPPPGW